MKTRTENFFDNRKQQAAIKLAVTEAIPAGAYYHNIIIAVAELLAGYTHDAYDKDTWEKPVLPISRTVSNKISVRNDIRTLAEKLRANDLIGNRLFYTLMRFVSQPDDDLIPDSMESFYRCVSAGIPVGIRVYGPKLNAELKAAIEKQCQTDAPTPPPQS